MQLEAGQVFGRYTIECVLGEGGMGRVYRASDTKLLRRVALKLLASPDGAELILREARAAAAITHENAVTIFDVGEVDGVPYIAMEHIQGESLRALVGDDAIAIDQKIEWLASIARALAAAHDRGLVHRDVKPENVLVRETDSVIKVLDFGIAHHTTTVEALGATFPEGLALSPDTRISGTPAYMAPEQLRGESFDGRADQFAWGLVAYELLTGEHPYPSENLSTLIADLLSRAPSPIPRSLALPDHVEAVVLRTLSKDPADRFPTMTELLSALTLTDAKPSLRPPKSAPGSSPSRAPSPLENARTESASPVVVPSPRSSRRRALVIAAAVLLAVSLVIVFRLSNTAKTTSTSSDAGRLPGSPTAVTELSLPKTDTLEALSEYRAGLQSARDGAGSEARVHFAHAAKLDPTMANAHLWVATLSAIQSRSEARAAFDHARQQRASLMLRDAQFLTALEPLLDRDPPDLAASERLFAAASVAFPGDAHLRLQLAIVRAARGQANALVDADAALKLDPKYVAAHLVRALALESLGKEADALTTYEKCVTEHPSSASCFAGELKLLSRKGECERVGEEARRWTTSHPSDPEAFRQRAIFLSAKPGSNDNIAELLTTSRALLPATTRPRRERIDSLWLQLFAGDLNAAKTSASFMANEATDLSEHGEAAAALVEIYEEMGRIDEAGRVASDFLKRRELWSGAARMEQDPTALFAAKARRANLISTVEAAEVRDEWLERWATRGRNGERWLIGHASGVDTPDEAKRAFAALAPFEPLPTLPDGRLSAALGHAYLLDGRSAEAIAALERAAGDCGVLRAPIVHARALLWLGEALAAKGDTKRACEVHRKIGAMWSRPSSAGGAKPITLTRAFAAMQRQGCGS